jgi:hypothetical protein
MAALYLTGLLSGLSGHAITSAERCSTIHLMTYWIVRDNGLSRIIDWWLRYVDRLAVIAAAEQLEPLPPLKIERTMYCTLK